MWILNYQLINLFEITDTSICYCWSGNLYKDCCSKKIHEPRIPYDELKKTNPKNYRGIIPLKFAKILKDLDKNCIICNKKAIQSHTISKNRMKKVFSSDYVCTPILNPHWDVLLVSTPINDASCFLWWCFEHDNLLFHEIDESFDLSNNYQLNLLWYRATSKIYREKLDLQKIAYTFFSHFLVRKWRHSVFSEIADMNVSRQTLQWWYDFMKYLETWIKNKNWNGLTHKLFNLWKIEPLFLSSAVESHIYKNYKTKTDKSILNIYTDKNHNWYLIYSYRNWDKDSEKLYKHRKKQEKKWNFIHTLNEFICKWCQNVICDIDRIGNNKKWLLIQPVWWWNTDVIDVKYFDYVKKCE